GFVSASAMDSPLPVGTDGGVFSLERNQLRGLSRETNPLPGLAVGRILAEAVVPLVSAGRGGIGSGAPAPASSPASRAALIGSSSLRRTTSTLGDWTGWASLWVGGGDVTVARRFGGAAVAFVCSTIDPLESGDERAGGLLVPASAEGELEPGPGGASEAICGGACVGVTRAGGRSSRSS